MSGRWSVGSERLSRDFALVAELLSRAILAVEAYVDALVALQGFSKAVNRLVVRPDRVESFRDRFNSYLATWRKFQAQQVS